LGTFQARHASKRRRLAAAGWPEQRKKLALFHGKADIVDGVNRSSPAQVELLDQVLDIEHSSELANVE
jgi:hypothetical protein